MPEASANIARVSPDLDQPNDQLERKRDLLRSVVVELQLAIDALTAEHLPNLPPSAAALRQLPPPSRP